MTPFLGRGSRWLGREEGGRIRTVFFHLSFNFRTVWVYHLWKIPTHEF